MEPHTTERPVCLLTGASSGIGLELARALARRNIGLILVARRVPPLQTLKQFLEATHGVRVHVYGADLSDPVNAEAVYRAIRNDGHRIDMLVNNAGSGLYGAFSETDLEGELRMVQLNISSLVALTKLVLPDMLAAGKGRIMNLASLVAFWPFPYFSVYAATKSFVLHFTEALRAEVAGRGISVTALCPGTADTGFTTPGMARTNAYSTNVPMDPKVIAERGAKALLRGEGTVVVGWKNKLFSAAPRTVPRWVMLRIAAHLGSPRK